MRDGLRVVIASYGAAQFRFLRETLTVAGHVPAAYLVSRSMRPSVSAEPDLLAVTNEIVANVPAGIDLLLPGSASTLSAVLAAYRPDVLLVFGFNWRLPPDVLAVPRLGAVNIHPSALPKYRGPSPVLWAIRNGDAYMGLSVHRMTDRIDAGPILAQVDDLPLPDRVTSQDVWRLEQLALPRLLDVAFDRPVHADPGTPQDEGHSTYAGFPPGDWYTVTWQGSRQHIHNQIRALRYLKRGEEPVVELQGRAVRVDGTSLTENDGLRIECADGPLWVTCTPIASPECLQRLKGQGLWLWRRRFEGEAGLAEEGVDEVGSALDGPESAAGQGLELVEGGRGVIAQAAFHD